MTLTTQKDFSHLSIVFLCSLILICEHQQEIGVKALQNKRVRREWHTNIKSPIIYQWQGQYCIGECKKPFAVVDREGLIGLLYINFF